MYAIKRFNSYVPYTLEMVKVQNGLALPDKLNEMQIIKTGLNVFYEVQYKFTSICIYILVCRWTNIGEVLRHQNFSGDNVVLLFDTWLLNCK